MPETYSLLIRGAVIVDGTGAPRYAGDVAVVGNRIAAIGDLSGATADRELHADGKVLAPGFIDAHTHDDRMLLSDGDMRAKVSQGVTCVVAGNCGISLAPMPVPVPDPVTPPLDLLDNSGAWYRYRSFADYTAALEETPPAVNFALLVGHTTLRAITMDTLDRPARPDEISQMQKLVQEAMEAGAIGVSTGLAYPPAKAAPNSEVIAVCTPMVPFGGLYATHMRDEGEHILESLQETFDVGESLGVQTLISHHKLAGTPSHGRSAETLGIINRQRDEQHVSLDCYPYAASSTILTMDHARGSARTLVTWSKGLPEFAGKDLAVVAEELGCSVEDAVARLQPAGAVYFRMDEADVQRILAYGPTMIGSDGLPHDQFPHPRLWGTFPRVLGHYSRDLGLFTLETAVHKMTGLTAAEFGFADRGVIRKGASADLTLFDASKIMDRATFEDPIQIADGVEAVIVNGRVVWQDGAATGARPGTMLRRTKPQTMV